MFVNSLWQVSCLTVFYNRFYGPTEMIWYVCMYRSDVYHFSSHGFNIITAFHFQCYVLSILAYFGSHDCSASIVTTLRIVRRSETLSVGEPDLNATPSEGKFLPPSVNNSSAFQNFVLINDTNFPDTREHCDLSCTFENRFLYSFTWRVNIAQINCHDVNKG
jgi:hypothetical protein